MDGRAANLEDDPAWLRFGFLLATVLTCAIALSPNNVDPDLWGHVQYAEDALAAGHLHEAATHTFTAVGHRWINHENLSEFALAFGYRLLGPRGMLAAKCLLGLGVVWLMLRAALRQGVSLPVACAFQLLVATTLTAFWATRPQLASFVLLAAMVAALDRAFARWGDERRVDARWLCALPPLLAVWANAHGGFIAGYCLLVAYLGLRGLEAIYYLRREAWRPIGVFALVAAAGGLATLINPYGAELHWWLANSLRFPRPEITEWAPPSPAKAFFLPMTLLYATAAVCWIGTRRRRDWTQIVLLTLFIWQSLLHARHIPLAAVLAGFWLPVHVQSLAVRFRNSRESRVESREPTRAGAGGPTPQPAWLTALPQRGVGLALALGLLVFKLDRRLRDMPVGRGVYPVAAVQYMADHDLHGKLVVHFNWAQYALAALPDSRVAFDGRFRTCYPQEVIDMHFDFLYGTARKRRFRSPRSGPIDGDRVLDYRRPDLVLLDRAFQPSVEVMRRRDDFVLLYQDEVAQLWGRRARYDDPASPHYLAASERAISDAPQRGSVTWPAFPTRSDRRSASSDQLFLTADR
jgi:hypothetical protein